MEKAKTESHRLPRILLVDDDPIQNAVASMALRAEAFDVDEAADGGEALSLIDKQDYDLVILDLEMPVMNGFKVLEELNAHPRHRHLPVIVVTTRADPVAVEKSYDLGATSFEVKPIKWNVMVHHVRFAIRASQLAKELRISKQEAEEASRMKGNLLSIISHEFRTPIHAISGFSKLIKKQVTSVSQSAELSDNLDEITGAAARLNKILGDILLVSSNFNGTDNLCEDDYHASDLVAKTVQSFKENQAPDRDITIAIDPSLPDDAEILCDRDMFQRAAMHILDNAVRFSPPASPITVTAGLTEQGDLFFSVKDQGPGMSQNQIKKSLEIFSQNDMSSSRSANGLGLGLAISNMICTAHCGYLSVHSAPEAGSTVSLVFPAHRVTVTGQMHEIAAVGS